MTQINTRRITGDYPDIFRHVIDVNPNFKITCEEGWRLIIRALCKLLYNATDSHNNRYNYFMKLSETKKAMYPDRERMISAITYPQVEQIKEKFGLLRFYVTNVDPQIEQLVIGGIILGETLSSMTCENCGYSGELRSDTPHVQTLCNGCYSSALRSPRYIPRSSSREWQVRTETPATRRNNIADDNINSVVNMIGDMETEITQSSGGGGGSTNG